MIKWIIQDISRALLILLLASLSFLYFIFCTTLGLIFTIHLASAFIPGNLHIKQVEGDLLHSVLLTDIQYTDKTRVFAIKQAKINFIPALLLQGKLKLALNITHLDLNQLNPNWQGYLNLKLSSLMDKQKISFQTEQIEGRLFSHPITGSVSYTKTNPSTSLKALISIGDAKFDLAGETDTRWHFNWLVQIPSLTHLYPQFSGAIYSTGQIVGSREQPSSQLVFTAKNLQAFHYQQAEVKGKITSSYQHTVLTHHIEIETNEHNRLQGNVNFPHFNMDHFLDQAIEGNINLDIKNLNFVNALISHPQHPTGILTGSILLNGTLAHPLFTSQLSLHQGQFTLPKLGLTVNHIELSGKQLPNSPIHVTGQFDSNKTSAKIESDIHLETLSLALKLKSQNLTILDLPHYHIQAAPTIAITVNPEEIYLSGDIDIPYADISPSHFNNVVELPEEAVIIQPNQTPSLPQNLSMNINLHLGKQVHLAYQNYSGELGGDLTIKTENGNPPTGLGKLYSKQGYYRAYGQSLSIETGYLIYAGNALLNPGLSIRAAKQIKTLSLHEGNNQFTSQTGLSPQYIGGDSLTVGIQVTGTFNHPLIQTYSTPAALKQADILSYLIFGYPQSQASPNNMGILLQAASSLNINNKASFSNISARIEKTLGLNEFAIGSNDVFNPQTNLVTPTATLNIGKKIGHNLYLDYRVGLFTPLSILNLRYQLSRRLSVESQISTIENGMDLFYGFETNQ